MPSVANLARFKISGKLPTLQLNFSDTKYKSVLRLVDVTIPKFDDEIHPATDSTAGISPSYQLPSGLFDLPATEYNVDDEDDEDAKDDHTIEEGSREVRQLVCVSDSIMSYYSFVLTGPGIQAEDVRAFIPSDDPTCITIQIARFDGGEVTRTCFF